MPALTLQWNQALEFLQAGQIHPVLLTFSASRNCSQSDYPARGADDDSENGHEPAQRHKNKGEDFPRGCVIGENLALGYSGRVTSRPERVKKSPNISAKKCAIARTLEM